MNPSSEIDISGLRCYDKIVDDVTYSVPRGITREARGRVWIVRVRKDESWKVNARFTDLRFGGTRRALDAAIIHLLYSGHAWRRDDVLQLGNNTVVHWRKRSGVGLCAVAYVSRNEPGRGETFFLATYKRIASGRGLEKLHARLVQVLESAHEIQHGKAGISGSAQDRIREDIHQALGSEVFRAFLLAGQRKADEIAVADYVERLRTSGDQP
ncbi:hypothetical protein ACKUFS_00315 [Pseudomonas cannabina]|uniref:Uncharacterized protein n=1 Tax=Pseudomonas syringae pv. maculicola str. ES4326 TaxID=629265 RepID=A0A8T8BY34_PSEYM|nr:MULTISPECIES: hypothetical protein [Pseudomonas syringae group]KPB72472.1 Uncharacterized protein AC507_2200 [Pseudomonas syringae pv. maculicola]QHE95986.1 hypothetical protein PMA4326_004725 [Pseudomonas syringae pv. maculicola str. ES4326]QQN23003.1 hypothetical protein JGS08_04815 [Pseudomonas cannabina pv. alisalensis]UBY96636.1 hypothetical protein LCG56_22145 [Pseudomonas cannabina pv. alisalensis]